MFRLFLVTIVAIFSGTASFALGGNCFNEFDSGLPCEVPIGSTTIIIQNNGLFTRSDNNKLKLSLPQGFHLELVDLDCLTANGLIVLTITDGDEAGTLIVSVEPKDMKLKWSTEVPAFNASPLLIEGHAIYLGGIGTVAKLGLKDGQIIWMQTNLYENDTQAFNSFVQPRKDGNTIIFTEQKVSSAKYDGIRDVRVDDLTGKILTK
jgi:hypothetical protein